MKRATLVIAKMAHGASTPTQFFSPAFVVMVTGGPVAHRASRNSFAAALSYGGCFCGCILRRMLSRHQPHRLHDIKLFAGHRPRRKRALPQDDGLPLLSVTAFVTGQQWCLCTRFAGLGCTTRASSAPASPSRQTLVRDTTSLQKKPWRAPSVQTRGFPGTDPRCSWVPVRMRTRLLC